ncbi:MAG TPA: MarR family transcriptional regulator [Acidimicrobiia bacterium]|nr:MarR family transcriptional regulator [Acidimicrobiia bacterium]
MTAHDVRWLTESEMTAWRDLIRTTTGLLAVLDNELQAAHGLTLGDYEVLARLSEAPDHALRMSDLAAQLHLSPSGITRRIDGLVRAGHVERRRCPSDRRGSNAVLTKTGLQTLRRAAPTHVRGVREHFIDRLSPEALGNLAGALADVEVDPSLAAGGCDEA